MKRVEICIHLVIDDLGNVKTEKIDYITRGTSDAVLFNGTDASEDVPTTEEVVAGPKLASAGPSPELLVILASLGLNDEEVTRYAAEKTERRIRDVATWIKHKNGVASPAGLARKLFATG